MAAMKKGSNLERLVDDYCDAALTEKIAKKAKDLRRAELLPLTSETKPMITRRYCLTYTCLKDVESLDTEAIRRDMPVEWIAKYTKKSDRQTFKVTDLTGLSRSLI